MPQSLPSLPGSPRFSTNAKASPSPGLPDLSGGSKSSTLGSRTPLPLEGIVLSIIFRKPETSWGILKLDFGSFQTWAKGNLLPSSPGIRLLLDGTWEDDPRFGWGLRVSSKKEIVPTEPAALYAYLLSFRFPHLTPQSLLQIIARWGRRTFDILENRTDKIADLGFSPSQIRALALAIQKRLPSRSLLASPERWGLNEEQAQTLFDLHQGETLPLLRRDPFRLLLDAGLPTEAAERVASQLGWSRHDPRRAIAQITTLLQEAASSEGHTALPFEGILARSRSRRLSIPPAQAEEALKLMLQDGSLSAVPQLKDDLLLLPSALSAMPTISSPAFEAEAVENPPPEGDAETLLPAEAAENPPPERDAETPPPAPPLKKEEKEDKTSEAGLLGLSVYTRAEEFIAERLLTLAKTVSSQTIQPPPEGLNPEQAEAHRAAQIYHCLLLTGGPGTGKTYTLRSILQAGWRRPLLASPTGKAAKRLSDLTGQAAFTLHRLLEADLQTGRFGRDASEPLDTDLLIVDEASMLDIPLAEALLRAIDPTKTRLLLVGDAEQLPPVGPGNLFADLIRCAILPTVRLYRIIRQDLFSQIIPNARRILQGSPILVDNATYLDFKFFGLHAPTQVAEQQAFLEAFQETFEILTEQGFSPQDIQVLTPMKKGPLPGAYELNSHLQRFLNPPRGKPKELRLHQIFRPGDRVIQLRNDYEREIFNGDTGIVQAIHADGMTVDFDQRRIAIDKASARYIELAYAISIHKSQGSEWPVVILPLSLSHRPILSRRLLYTGMTRAQTLLILLGDARAIGYTLQNNLDSERSTALPAFLAEKASLERNDPGVKEFQTPCGGGGAESPQKTR